MNADDVESADETESEIDEEAEVWLIRIYTTLVRKIKMKGMSQEIEDMRRERKENGFYAVIDG